AQQQVHGRPELVARRVRAAGEDGLDQRDQLLGAEAVAVLLRLDQLGQQVVAGFPPPALDQLLDVGRHLRLGRLDHRQVALQVGREDHEQVGRPPGEQRPVVLRRAEDVGDDLHRVGLAEPADQLDLTVRGERGHVLTHQPGHVGAELVHRALLEGREAQPAQPQVLLALGGEDRPGAPLERRVVRAPHVGHVAQQVVEATVLQQVSGLLVAHHHRRAPGAGEPRAAGPLDDLGGGGVGDDLGEAELVVGDWHRSCSGGDGAAQRAAETTAAPSSSLPGPGPLASTTSAAASAASTGTSPGPTPAARRGLSVPTAADRAATSSTSRWAAASADAGPPVRSPGAVDPADRNRNAPAAAPNASARTGRLKRRTAGRTIASAAPWGMPARLVSAWPMAWARPRPVERMARPARWAANNSWDRAARSRPSATAVARWPETSSTARRASPAATSLARRDASDSRAWVSASIPVAAVTGGGTPRVSSGSSTAATGTVDSSPR